MSFRIKDVMQKVRHLEAGTLPWVWCLPNQFLMGSLQSSVLQMVINGHVEEIEPQLIIGVARYNVRILQIID